MYYENLTEYTVTIKISAGLDQYLDYDNVRYARMIMSNSLKMSTLPRLLRREIEDALIAASGESSFDWKVEVDVEEEENSGGYSY